jgi:uncharacterized protein (DUF952 family)
MRIYKIVPRNLWELAVVRGEFHGSLVDERDGFIHLSAQDQVEGTLRLHFVGQSDLLLIGVDAACLGESLRWEPSRGGLLFPHLFSPLSLRCVVSTDALPLKSDGNHDFPPWWGLSGGEGPRKSAR